MCGGFSDRAHLNVWGFSDRAQLNAGPSRCSYFVAYFFPRIFVVEENFGMDLLICAISQFSQTNTVPQCHLLLCCVQV